MNQHFGLGEMIVKVTNGIIEGQSTSTKIQMFYYQMLFNIEYMRLKEQNNLDEAISLSKSSFIFVDDSFNYMRMLKDRQHMIHSKFVLEYEEHIEEAIFVGIIVYLCKICHALSVRMDKSKHQGKFFPRSLLDHYGESNVPHRSLKRHIVNAAIRIYRHNSDVFTALEAFAELKQKMSEKKSYPSAYKHIKINSTANHHRAKVKML